MNDHERRDVERDVYVSLRDHFTALLSAQDRRIEQALTASKLAVDKAETSQERRLDLLNEFRAQAADESVKYALRENVEQLNLAGLRRITNLETQVARLYGGLAVVAFIGLAGISKAFFG